MKYLTEKKYLIILNVYDFLNSIFFKPVNNNRHVMNHTLI